MASPNSASSILPLKSVALVSELLEGELESGVAADVELLVPSWGTSGGPASSSPKSESVPSSSPLLFRSSNHIGRITPVSGSYAKTWLLCSTLSALFVHGSTVMGAGEEGLSSYVAQKVFMLASSGSNIGRVIVTLRYGSGIVELSAVVVFELPETEVPFIDSVVVVELTASDAKATR